MHLEFSPAADADLVEIAGSIARDDVPRAVTCIDELEAACARLIDYPHSGVARSELRADLRSTPHGSGEIFCSVLEKLIRIEPILHGARDIGSILAPSQAAISPHWREKGRTAVLPPARPWRILPASKPG